MTETNGTPKKSRPAKKLKHLLGKLFKHKDGDLDVKEVQSSTGTPIAQHPLTFVDPDEAHHVDVGTSTDDLDADEFQSSLRQYAAGAGPRMPARAGQLKQGALGAPVKHAQHAIQYRTNKTTQVRTAQTHISVQNTTEPQPYSPPRRRTLDSPTQRSLLRAATFAIEHGAKQSASMTLEPPSGLDKARMHPAVRARAVPARNPPRTHRPSSAGHRLGPKTPQHSTKQVPANNTCLEPAMLQLPRIRTNASATPPAPRAPNAAHTPSKTPNNRTPSARTPVRTPLSAVVGGQSMDTPRGKIKGALVNKVGTPKVYNREQGPQNTPTQRTGPQRAPVGGRAVRKGGTAGQSRFAPPGGYGSLVPKNGPPGAPHTDSPAQGSGAPRVPRLDLSQITGSAGAPTNAPAQADSQPAHVRVPTVVMHKRMGSSVSSNVDERPSWCTPNHRERRSSRGSQGFEAFQSSLAAERRALIMRGALRGESRGTWIEPFGGKDGTWLTGTPAGRDNAVHDLQGAWRAGVAALGGPKGPPPTRIPGPPRHTAERAKRRSQSRTSFVSDFLH